METTDMTKKIQTLDKKAKKTPMGQPTPYQARLTPHQPKHPTTEWNQMGKTKHHNTPGPTRAT